MSLADNIYQHSRRLPEQAAREALDFIQFLEQRYVDNATLPSRAKDTESFLAAVAGTLSDDFPDNITDDSLQYKSISTKESEYNKRVSIAIVFDSPCHKQH